MSQKPSLGRVVLVRTPMPLAGQEESVGIVTQVMGEERINVTILPGSGGVTSAADVYPAGHHYAGAHSWRWPDRA